MALFGISPNLGVLFGVPTMRTIMYCGLIGVFYLRKLPCVMEATAAVAAAAAAGAEGGHQ